MIYFLRWSLITITTIGLGDRTPMTVGRRIFGGMCAICGIFLLSLPIGVILHKFSEIAAIKSKIIKIETNKLKKLESNLTKIENTQQKALNLSVT